MQVIGGLSDEGPTRGCKGRGGSVWLWRKKVPTCHLSLAPTLNSRLLVCCLTCDCHLVIRQTAGEARVCYSAPGYGGAVSLLRCYRDPCMPITCRRGNIRQATAVINHPKCMGTRRTALIRSDCLSLSITPITIPTAMPAARRVSCRLSYQSHAT